MSSPTSKSTSVPKAPNANVKNSSTNSGMIDKAKDWVKNVFENKGPVLIFIIIVILVFIIVIIYIVFAMKNSSLSGKMLIPKPIKLNELSVPYEVSSTDIPKPVVGREYSFGFWLYIEQFEQTPGNNKLIFYRGSKDDVSMANPIVMLDSTENRMYICFKTQDNSLNPTELKTDLSSTSLDLRKIVDKNYFKNPTLTGSLNKYIIMEVDYVPLQRWVSFVAIVDNKIISLFMDGEIYSVKSTDELKAMRKPDIDANGNPIKYNLIVDRTDGNIYVGKNALNNKITVNGYLSKLEFHNYAVSINSIKHMYNAGPLANGLLGSLGIQYGVRSPIYKLDENVK